MKSYDRIKAMIQPLDSAKIYLIKCCVPQLTTYLFNCQLMCLKCWLMGAFYLGLWRSGMKAEAHSAFLDCTLST